MHISYSVIIPHRDSVELLRRAVKSIPERIDIQIIVVDNSPKPINLTSLIHREKGCFEILYSNCRHGAGHARNVGLTSAQGDWILFLDADDFYVSGAFEAFDKYVDTDFDIVYFSPTSVYSDTFNEAERHKVYEKLVSKFESGKEKTEDNLRYWFVSPWSKLIRHSLIQKYNIRFDEVPASNDLLFSIKSGHFAKKIYADNFPAYCITINKGSLTRTISKKNSRSRYCAYIRQYQFMVLIGRPDLRFRLLSTVLKSLRFGIKEFVWYISKAHKEKVNIFLGTNQWLSLVYKYCIRNKRNRYKNYTIIEN